MSTCIDDLDKRITALEEEVAYITNQMVMTTSESKVKRLKMVGGNKIEVKEE